MALRILHVSPYYHPAVRYGGPVPAMRGWVRGLVDLGAEVTVETTDADGPRRLSEPGTERVDGASVRRHRRLGGGYFFSPGLALSVARATRSADVVHVHGLWTWATLVATRLAPLAGRPYVVAPHGCLDAWALGHHALRKRAYLRLLEAGSLRGAAAVHCLTEAEAEDVRRLWPGARVAVVPPAVEVPPPGAAPDPAPLVALHPELAGKRVVLFLSRLHAKKGLPALARAFAMVAAGHPELHLLVAGPDEDGTAARARAELAAVGLAARATFPGLLDGPLKSAALAAAEVFCLPSASEGLPVAALEAMAAGVPVVLSPACNLTEPVLAAGAGLVAEPTPAALAAALATVLADRDRARAMGAAGRALVQRRHALRGVAQSLLELYESALGRRA